MFKLTRIPVIPVRRDPVRLPITLTLGVPDDECVDRSEFVFNLPGAIHQLIGSVGWEEAMRALQPRVWAPGWTDARLRALVARPFRHVKRPRRPFVSSVEGIRSYDLLPALSSGRNDPDARREVIHLLASFDTRAGHEPLLRLGRSNVDAPRTAVEFGMLRDALVSANTRLLILQVVDLSPARALEFGERIAGSGGPATLVVSGGTPETLDKYFLDLYANLIHNQPLPAAAGRPARLDPSVTLIIGKGADETLQLHRWLDEFREDLEFLKTANRDYVRDVVGSDLKLLHKGQIFRLQREAESAVRGRAKTAGPPLDDPAVLNDIAAKIEWGRESTGLLPLSQLAFMAPPVQAMAQRYRQLPRQELESSLKEMSRGMAEAAPRAINANFALPGAKQVLSPSATLTRGRRYDLLVDIGPRWNKLTSLVRGNAAFPEAALPPGKAGHEVHVAFFSDDFAAAAEPRGSRRSKGFSTAAAAADMWLPRSGRSHPMIAGRALPKSGPVRLTLVLRKQARRVARGRLSVYYAGNLLQSATVTMNVAARGGKRIDRPPNAVAVDYVFSGSFAELEKHESRDLGTISGTPVPVGLSIAMNADGAGGHRIMIVGSSVSPMSRPYDPGANKKLLEKSRATLRECFAARKKECEPDTSREGSLAGLGADGSRSFEAFLCDLWKLAWLGSDLYTHVFGQIAGPSVTMMQNVDQALSSRRVIQVARTDAAQYVFPWALVYDIPLPDRNDKKKLQYCPSLEEWKADGGRKKTAAETCRFQNTPAHRKNMLCPYGFWGLKHIIEQPINTNAAAAFADATNVVPDVPANARWQTPPAMAIGFTRDTALDPKQLSDHFTEMKKLADCRPDGGAQSWEEVQSMLAQPDIVYFLCHGEFDPRVDAPYLGIGPRDASYQHRVYAGDLVQWARTIEDFWSGRHPLVFINGCHTANLMPDQILNFVTSFAILGAGAVIGTEISVRLPLAVKVAENFFQRMATPDTTIGGAMYATRWDFANKGNLLGLAYTPYGLSSFKFQQADRPQ